MANWLKHAAELAEKKESFVLVTVCGVEGSAPREAGAKMIVTQNRQWGTIGGGNLEFSAVARAKKMIGNDERGMHFEDYPLGPAFGQCCGGKVRIGYERLDVVENDWLAEAAQVFESGATLIIEHNLSGKAGAGEWRLARSGDARDFTCGVAFLDETGAELVSSMPSLEKCGGWRETIRDHRPRVFIFGAGHVGAAIVQILQAMPVVTTWVDRRPGQFPRETDNRILTHCSDREAEFIRAAPADACYFILTHDHQLDYELVLETLNRGDSAYCGLIGSRTKRMRFERRLVRAGIDKTQLKRLTCPIGAGGLTSKEPEIIALSAVHEMFRRFETSAKENETWS